MLGGKALLYITPISLALGEQGAGFFGVLDVDDLLTVSFRTYIR